MTHTGSHFFSFFYGLVASVSRRALTVFVAGFIFQIGSSAVLAQEGVVNLGSTVAGNQEQPKVLYIVPWQSPEANLDFNQNFNSQLNAVFGHLDRAELKRQIQYLKILNDDGGSVNKKVQ